METQTKNEAVVTRIGLLGIQVCVPSHWSDDDVVSFANNRNPAGTTAGWVIRRQGDTALAGDDERVPCSDLPGFVHIMLDC